MDMDKQDATHVFLLGKLALNFPGGLSLAVKEDFAHTTDPPGTELTGRIKSTTNVLPPSVEYVGRALDPARELGAGDRKSTRLNSSHVRISYAVFCLTKKNDTNAAHSTTYVRRP